MQPGPEKDRLRRLHVVTANEYFDWEPVYRDNVERARRLFVMAAAAALGTVVGAVLLVSLFASGALPWLVGTILVVAASGVVVLGLHAGGHGWFVPIPVTCPGRSVGFYGVCRELGFGDGLGARRSRVLERGSGRRLRTARSRLPARPRPRSRDRNSSWAPAALPSALLPRGG